MSVRVTNPVPLGPHNLVDTDVAEADYPPWLEATSYTLGERCIKGHQVWEAAQDHTGHDPELDLSANFWLRVGRTNRWAAFELEQVTSTHRADGLFYEFDPGQAITAVHLFGLLDCNSVRVSLTDPVAGLVYDSGPTSSGRLLRSASFYEFFWGTRRVVDLLNFYNMPIFPRARLRIELEGGAGLGVQAIVAGMVTDFGLGVQYGAEIGVQSFSTVQRDRWGVATLRRGNYIKTLRGKALVARAQTDRFADFLADADSQVRVWDFGGGYRNTKVLGIVSRWASLIDYPNHTVFSLDIDGMAIK